MNYLRYALIPLLLVLHACEDKKVEASYSETPVAIEPQTKTESQLDLMDVVDDFIDEVLNENQRYHQFELPTNKQPKHLEIFSKDGLQKVSAYSDKRYPRNTSPRYYEHFTLFILNYQNADQATQAYNKLKMETSFDYKKLNSLQGEEKARKQFLFSQTKPGGMICYKKNFLFSIVETCRNTPIGGTWLDYENLFLRYITDKNETIKVLNADCGQIQYREETRKT